VARASRQCSPPRGRGGSDREGPTCSPGRGGRSREHVARGGIRHINCVNLTLSCHFVLVQICIFTLYPYLEGTRPRTSAYRDDDKTLPPASQSCKLLGVPPQYVQPLYVVDARNFRAPRMPAISRWHLGTRNYRRQHPSMQGSSFGWRSLRSQCEPSRCQGAPAATPAAAAEASQNVSQFILHSLVCS